MLARKSWMPSRVVTNACTCICALAIVFGTAASEQRPPVLVFAVDGLSPYACSQSPGFLPLIQHEAAYTLRARTTEHTRSVEGFQSLFMGGYVFGANRSDVHPPLFTYIRTHKPNANLWLLSDYHGLDYAVNESAADYFVAETVAPRTVGSFLATLSQRSTPPDLTVMYFMDADNAGHRIGWHSDEYKATVEVVAEQIQRVLSAMPNATYFIVSDHGGQGLSHYYKSDTRSMDDDDANIDSVIFRDVPWAVRYKGAESRALCHEVRTDITAAEIARAMGVPPHPSWPTLWMGEENTCSFADVGPRHSVATPGRLLHTGSFPASHVIILLVLFAALAVLNL